MNQNIQRAVTPAPVPMPRPITAPMPVAEFMTPKELLGILRRHVWMIILFTIGGAVVGTAAHFLLQQFYPRYSTKAQIEVLVPVDGDPMTFPANQPQKDTYYQFRFTKAALVKQQALLNELIQDADIRSTSWFKQFADVDADGNIIGGRDKAVKKAIEDLEDHLSATAPRDFVFIEIGMTTCNAAESAKIVNKMVEKFTASQRDLALQSIRAQLAERTKQREEVIKRRDTLEASLGNIRSGTRFARLNLSDNNTFRDYMDVKIADIESSFSSLDSYQSNLEVQIATLKRRAETAQFEDVTQEQVEQDAIARQIRSNIAATEPILAERLTRLGEDHRSVKEIRDSLKQMYSDLAKRQKEIGDIYRKSEWQSAEDQMAALVQQLDTTTKQLKEAQAEYKDVDLIRAEYNKLEVQRQDEIALLNEMNTYIEKLYSQIQDPQIAKLRTLNLAPVPLWMSFPKIELLLPVGIILGLFAGLGLAFAIELLNDLLRTPSDVMRHLRIPLLGTICHSDDDKDIQGIELAHVVRQAPYSIMSENYRQLRTNLKLSGPGGSEHKTLLITSPAAGDGKTSVAVNLASTMLYENKRVLLIDANLRRPSTAHLFPRTETNGTVSEHPDFGLSNYLMGQCSDEKDIIRFSSIEGLDVVDSGPLPANPAELLDSPRMQQFLERCKQVYDYVIIDGPALLVSDAKVLASGTDGTLVVFSAAGTHRGAAQRILRELQHVHANTLGTVLMGVKSRKGGYFREAYRSYQDYQRVQIKQAF
ncbi:MAG: polysaccharide biosynthesis tyrosine autokinase [Anaerohalosphaeraceae bacterium]